MISKIANIDCCWAWRSNMAVWLMWLNHLPNPAGRLRDAKR